jgi:hypothetical protein
MKKIHDRRCLETAAVFETYDYLDADVRCSCGAETVRLISPVRSVLNGSSGDFPGAAMKWEREHAKGNINGRQH